MLRPPESTSSVAVVLAAASGWRSGSSVTAVPSFTRDVNPATQASVVNWSRNGRPGAMRNSPSALYG